MKKKKKGSIYGRIRRSVLVQKIPKKTNSKCVNEPTDVQLDEQVERRIEVPEKRKTLREKVGLFQNQA